MWRPSQCLVIFDSRSGIKAIEFQVVRGIFVSIISKIFKQVRVAKEMQISQRNNTWLLWVICHISKVVIELSFDIILTGIKKYLTEWI